MKKDVHPKYNLVVFEDASSGFRILTGSTLSAKETTTWEDGQTYPLIRMEVSSASHPFYTGKQVLVDTAKRVDKFKARLEKQTALAGKTKGKAAKKVRTKKLKQAEPALAVAEK